MLEYMGKGLQYLGGRLEYLGVVELPWKVGLEYVGVGG